MPGGEGVAGAQQSRNRLLALLSAHDRSLILNQSAPVKFEAREVLYHSDDAMPFCYLVESGVISLMTILSDGQPAEVGLVGPEGMVGLSPLMGSNHSPGEAIVQLAGAGQRIRADALKRLFETHEGIRAAILKFVQARTVQISQTVVCNSRHDTQQRVARWLLAVDSRSAGATVTVTQESLAMILGVRRQQVSISAAALQKAGFITYQHGVIEVTDLAGLKSAACECFGVVEREYERLLA